MTAKALFHKETLCKREEVQRFLSSLVLKPPEVGHLINCFHMAKTNSDTRNKKANVAAASTNLSKKGAKDGGPPRKVVTFSAIENFAYQTWRDFSDVRYVYQCIGCYCSACRILRQHYIYFQSISANSKSRSSPPYPLEKH